MKRMKNHRQVCAAKNLFHLPLLKKNCAAIFFSFCKGKEALAKARELQIQNSNPRLHQELLRKMKLKMTKLMEF